MKRTPPATGAASEQASHIFALLSNGGVAKASLRRVFREDSCINSTRVLFEVYRAFGVPAEAFAVRTRIYSRAFAERAHREGRVPETPEEVHSWTREPGVWSIGIGYGFDLRPGKWPGHLVLRAAGHLLDSTIDQASRPEHGIAMPPMLLIQNVPEGFWHAIGPLEVEVDGQHLIYEARPRDTSYVVSPAWSGRSDIEGKVAGDLVRYLKSKGVRAHG